MKLKNFDKDFGVNLRVFANQPKSLLLLKIFAKSSKILKTQSTSINFSRFSMKCLSGIAGSQSASPPYFLGNMLKGRYDLISHLLFHYPIIGSTSMVKLMNEQVLGFCESDTSGKRKSSSFSSSGHTHANCSLSRPNAPLPLLLFKDLMCTAQQVP